MAEPKTRALGIISVAKLSKHQEWNAYAQAAKAFSDAKDKAEEAKAAMKAALKKGSPDLQQIGNLDFTWSVGAKEISVFEQLQTTTRRRAKEIAFG